MDTLRREEAQWRPETSGDRGEARRVRPDSPASRLGGRAAITNRCPPPPTDRQTEFLSTVQNMNRHLAATDRQGGEESAVPLPRAQNAKKRFWQKFLRKPEPSVKSTELRTAPVKSSIHTHTHMKPNRSLCFADLAMQKCTSKYLRKSAAFHRPPFSAAADGGGEGARKEEGVRPRPSGLRFDGEKV